MKRVLLFVGGLLALILIGGPLAVGRVGQDNIERQLELVTESNPAITVVTESHDPGWFTGSSKHRIILTDADAVVALETLLGGNQFGDQPALVVNTRHDHGPVAFGSLGREGGSLAPAINRSVSTFALDLGDGETIALPGRVLLSVGLDGTSHGQLLVDPGSYSFPEDAATVTWDGADIWTEVGSGGREIVAAGTVRPFNVASAEGTVSVSAIEMKTKQTQTDYEGIWVGHGSYSMDSVEVGGTPAGDLSMKGLSVAGLSSIEGDYVSGSGKFSIEDIDGTNFTDVAMKMSMSAKSLDAVALQELTRIMREVQSSDDPAAQQQRLPEVLNNVQRLADRGAQLTFDKLQLVLPQGEVNGSVDLRFDRSPGLGQEFSPAALSKTLHGDLLFEVPEALLDDVIEAQSGNPMFAMALAYLEKDGGLYRLKATYEDGLLSVNGMPLPIPML